MHIENVKVGQKIVVIHSGKIKVNIKDPFGFALNLPETIDADHFNGMVFEVLAIQIPYIILACIAENALPQKSYIFDLRSGFRIEEASEEYIKAFKENFSKQMRQPPMFTGLIPKGY